MGGDASELLQALDEMSDLISLAVHGIISESTIYSRFRRRKIDGVWRRIFAQVQSLVEEKGAIDWDIHFVGDSTVRAHQPNENGSNSQSA